MKACSKCGENKDESQFYKDKRFKSGLRSDCKTCQNTRTSQWRRLNREKTNLSCRKYYERNKEKWVERNKSLPEEKRQQKLDYMCEYHAKNRERVVKRLKEWRKNRPIEEKKAYNQRYYKINKEKLQKISRESYKNLSKEQKKRNYETIKLFRKNNRDKAKAWFAVGNALIRGDMNKPNNCELCNIKERLHAHHEDYSKPLEVKWLCPKCHNEIHVDKRGKQIENY